MSDIDAILSHVDNNHGPSVDGFVRLLEFASVSSQEDGRQGIADCAAWLKSELDGIGFETRIIPTAGHPLVLAKTAYVGALPRVLLYGHYDVQPAEPFEDWTSRPFTPDIRREDGLDRIYARGASDSKGQVWSVIEALRAWKAVEGSFPFDVTVLLEGEEETGSPSLPKFIEDHRQDLACDVAFISDSDMWSRTRPAITTRLKGLVHEKVTVIAPNGDLHSGHYGNVAANPVRVLAKLLAAIHDDEGRVLIEGFYEGAGDLPQSLRDQWEALSVEEAAAGVDLRGYYGKVGEVEAMWGHPGVDFNGIVGGNTGPGERSVLPASAYARLSFRLVGSQKPDKVRMAFRNFVQARIPKGCRVEFEGEGGSTPVSIDETSPFIAATVRALDAEWPEPTLFKGTGGAIPLVGFFTDLLAVDCVVTGFIQSDDAIHAPDERYDLERLRKGTRSWVRILAELDLHFGTSAETRVS
jgi:acetylornithine deacetylase/succinyl-diaminopimelate desuccinylase-like protein